MPSCAGTGIVTICMLTFCSLSAIGMMNANPGWRTSGCTRPNRKTSPRSYCLITRALELSPIRPTITTTSSKYSRSMANSHVRARFPARLGYASMLRPDVRRHGQDPLGVGHVQVLDHPPVHGHHAAAFPLRRIESLDD